MFNFIMGLWILLFLGSAYSAIDPNAVKYYYEEEFGVQSEGEMGDNLENENTEYAWRFIIEENETAYIEENRSLYTEIGFCGDEGFNKFEKA